MNMAGKVEAHNHVLETAHSPFLRIPPELRLTIYDFALLDCPCVTIGHAEVVGKPADVVSCGGVQESRHLDGSGVESV